MKNTRGFTLLEMSVVLLIIALIVGGIMTGKTLIRQAELRSVMQEYDQYTKAVKEFVDKYQAIPGDMSNAETLWGSDGTCPNLTYTATLPTSTATCNGAGNGKVSECDDDLSRPACNTTALNVGEVWRMWQHLSNAGLIDGRFTGRTGGTSSVAQATPRLNVPASKLRPAGWTFIFYLNVSSSTYLPRDHYGHVFLFGGGKGSANGRFTTQPVVPVKDAYELDLKMDDGLPETGMLRPWKNYFKPTSDNGPTLAMDASSFCVNGTAYYVPDGTHDDKEYACSLVFIPGL